MAALRPLIQAALPTLLPMLTEHAAALARGGVNKLVGLFTAKQKRSILAAPPGQRKRLMATYLNGRGMTAGQMIAFNDSMPRKVGTEKISRDAQFRSNPTNRLQVAPSGHGYYDAFVQSPDSAVTVMSVGYATALKGMARITTPSLPATHTAADGTVTAGLDNGLLIILQNTGNDVTVGRMYHKQFSSSAGQSATALIKTDIDVEQFKDLPGDVETIPVRMSFRIRNITEGLRVGGLVRILRYAGGLVEPQHNDHLDVLEKMIRDSVHTCSYSGHELQNVHQKNAYVCDQSRATTFYSSSHTVPPAPAADSNYFEAFLRYPGMTPLMILIEPFSTDGSTPINNTYEITCSVQRLARFMPGSLLHSMAGDVKTAPPGHVNAARDAEEARGSQLAKVAGDIVQKTAPKYIAGWAGLKG